MKATLWTLLAAGLGTAVYLSDFGHHSGTESIALRAGAAVLAFGSALCLVLTRGERQSS